MSETQIIVSTGNDTWREVELDEHTGAWVPTGKSGRIVIDSIDNLPPARGSMLPDTGR